MSVIAANMLILNPKSVLPAAGSKLISVLQAFFYNNFFERGSNLPKNVVQLFLACS